jgi:hypothetical protein
MPTIEEKIQTLTQVARLLGEKSREQKRRITQLEEEVIKLKDEISELKETWQPKPIPTVTPSPTPKIPTSLVTPPLPQDTTPQEEIPPLQATESEKEQPEPIYQEKDSEKKELLEALKIIDNL